MTKYQNFLSENFPFLVVKFSVYMYLKRCVSVISCYFLTRQETCIVSGNYTPRTDETQKFAGWIPTVFTPRLI